MSLAGIPYWRLSVLYFTYFGLVGVMSPYWPVYLQGLGFSGNEIGLIIALPMLTRIAAPAVWGHIADRSGKYLVVVRWGASAGFATFIGLFFASDFWGVVFFTCLFTFFWNAILPQIEVITLDYLKQNTHNYSFIRLWGSIGFIVTVVGLGVAFEFIQTAAVTWIIWALLGAILLCTLQLPRTSHDPGSMLAPRIEQGKQAGVQTFCFFLASFLLHVSHGSFYGFYSLYMLEQGYTSTLVGILWALGVLAEIILFIKIPWIFRHFSLKTCLVTSIALASIRWIVVAWFPQYFGLMVLVQTFHAFTFGLAHSVAIEYVSRAFASSARGRAQALYSAVCFGAGGAFGAYLGGVFWAIQPAWCFTMAACMAAVGALIAYWGFNFKGMNKLITPQTEL